MDGELKRSNTSLFAISTRFPQGLKKALSLEEEKPGIFKILWGERTITIIVPKMTDKVTRNAMWHMHSWEPPLVDFGLRHYRWKSNEYSSILDALGFRYLREDLEMYTVEDFRKDYRETVLNEITTRELYRAIPKDELVGYLSEEHNCSPEQLKKLLGLK